MSSARLYAAPSVSTSGVEETANGGSSDGAGELRRGSAAAAAAAGQQRQRPSRTAATQRRYLVPRRTPSARSVGQRAQGVEAGRLVVGVVEEGAHEGGADDHAVGVRRHLGGLVAVADAEPDGDREVAARPDPRDERAGEVAGGGRARR